MDPRPYHCASARKRLGITFSVRGVLFAILVPWLPWFGLELVSFYYLDEISRAYFSWNQGVVLSLAVVVFAYLIFSWSLFGAAQGNTKEDPRVPPHTLTS